MNGTQGFLVNVVNSLEGNTSTIKKNIKQYNSKEISIKKYHILTAECRPISW
jgi:hypothetical protein